MPRASREQSERTASEILRIAAELFAQHGYAEVSLERVAAEAGVTRGAVYHHYADKRALFVAVLNRAQAAVAAAIREAAPGIGWGALLAGSLAFLRASASPEHRRILLVDGPAVVGWSEWRRMDAANSGVLLDDVLRDLDGLVLEPEAAATLLNGAMNEAALRVADGGRLEAAERSIRWLIDVLRDDSQSSRIREAPPGVDARA